MCFANDYDRKAASVYLNNFKGSSDYFFTGPISKWTEDKNFMVPKHDILVADSLANHFQLQEYPRKILRNFAWVLR